ncbi:uncharacterized protein STEHIDRAFT_83355 [Stereum hirsutum FP-91666 SS1]|uniref:uncharacterized protein n=1 Tax=Stereum hirsutum (strain FP-91666) TaxID=721885 RepID=UPI00044497AA|nr:uncharacterized protein STEHIDRAFT_83355 [Stereum hirsutum FP-91666 SS1]EIM83324.1 hypothetical protein STEHIDRAFT_83355 [Stereum hirsutum FP-91666 SS1]
MDFQFTSRPNSGIKPVWASGSQDPQTPQKRSHNDLTPTTPSFPTFGNQNVPFLFQSPLPQTPHSPAWAPPQNFSPAKAFPQQELKDVDMAEPSPPNREEPQEEERAVSLGGLKRVFKSRRKERERALRVAKDRRVGDSDEDSDSAEDSDDDNDRRSSPRKSRIQKLSHHYTLNMPSPSVEKPDLPYVLLGYVQFLFNLSLLLMFLYLVVQFILTIQRDVQYRVSEYSMETVQEISNCASQFKANLCGDNPVPAMIRQCGMWETCMSRDPTMVGRSRVSAELIGEVVNGFFEPISWKTMFFTVSSLAFLTFFINSLLSLYRSRHLPSHAPANMHHQPSYSLPPPGPYPPHYGWDRPWNGVDDDDNMPSRKRRLEGGEAIKIK